MILLDESDQEEDFAFPDSKSLFKCEDMVPNIEKGTYRVGGCIDSNFLGVE